MHGIETINKMNARKADNQRVAKESAARTYADKVNASASKQS